MTKTALESDSEMIMKIHNKANKCVENKNMDKSDVEMLSWTITQNGESNNEEQNKNIK